MSPQPLQYKEKWGGRGGRKVGGGRQHGHHVASFLSLAAYPSHHSPTQYLHVRPPPLLPAQPPLVPPPTYPTFCLHTTGTCLAFLPVSPCSACTPWHLSHTPSICSTLTPVLSSLCCWLLTFFITLALALLQPRLGSTEHVLSLAPAQACSSCWGGGSSSPGTGDGSGVGATFVWLVWGYRHYLLCAPWP